MALRGIVLCTLLFLGTAHAEAQRLAFAPPVGQEAVLLDELAHQTHFRFEETPLDAVCEAVFHKHGIYPVLDTRALDEIGIGTDTTLTRTVSNIPLGDALDDLLNSIDPSLTWMIETKRLIITTREYAEERLQTWIYDVTPLIEETYDVEYGPDFDSLIELITKTIEPDSWDEVGGPGSIAEFETNGKLALVIAQTHEIHRQIDRFLRTLYQLAGRQVPNVRALSPVARGYARRTTSARLRELPVRQEVRGAIYNPRNLPMTKDPKSQARYSPARPPSGFF